MWMLGTLIILVSLITVNFAICSIFNVKAIDCFNKARQFYNAGNKEYAEWLSEKGHKWLHRGQWWKHLKRGAAE